MPDDSSSQGHSMEWQHRVDRFFRISERGSTVATEIKSGVVSFLTMSYILLVNPQILGAAGLPVKAVVTATALSSMLASLACGLFANLPVGLSPGMGLNAYLVFSQVLGLDVPVSKALAGCMVAAGVVAVLALIRALSVILGIVPDSIKLAVVVGMGLLLTFIGMQTSKIVVPDKETMVTMGNLLGLEPVLAIGGLAVIASLHYRNVRGSIIIGVMLTALAYFVASKSWPTGFVALPHLQFFPLDFSDLFTRHPNPAAWSAVLAYTLVMVFDIGGAMFGLGNLAGLVKDGQVPGSVVTYLSAAAGTALGAATGTTPLIIAAESAVGIKEGGRTGLVAVTVAACFAVSMFLAPFMQAIPQVATAPVLVLVGAMMMGESTHIDWSSMLTAVPAFLTIVIQPFTFSIANGIYAGLAMTVLLWLLTGTFLQDFSAAKAAFYESGGSLAAAAGADLETPLLNGAQHYGAEEQAQIAAQLAGVADSPPALRRGSQQSCYFHNNELAQQQQQQQQQRQQQQAIPIGDARGGPRRSSYSITGPGGSMAGSIAGSLRGHSGAARGTPYERGSFTMFINTFGSHTVSPGGVLGSTAHMQPGSEEPGH